jgi:hypothetical protein
MEMDLSTSATQKMLRSSQLQGLKKLKKEQRERQLREETGVNADGTDSKEQTALVISTSLYITCNLCCSSTFCLNCVVGAVGCSRARGRDCWNGVTFGSHSRAPQNAGAECVQHR